MTENYLHKWFIDEAKCAIDSRGSSGTEIKNQDKVITEDGVYTPDEGYTGLGKVTVTSASETIDNILEAEY